MTIPEQQRNVSELAPSFPPQHPIPNYDMPVSQTWGRELVNMQQGMMPSDAALMQRAEDVLRADHPTQPVTSPGTAAWNEQRNNSYPMVASDMNPHWTMASYNNFGKDSISASPERTRTTHVMENVPMGMVSGPSTHVPSREWNWANSSGRLGPMSMVGTEQYTMRSATHPPINVVPSTWNGPFKPTGRTDHMDNLHVPMGIPAQSHGAASQSPAVFRKGDATAPNPMSERSPQEISTLFMAGFPDDITDREFSNMFLFAKGFEASMLKYPTPSSNSLKGDEADSRKLGERHSTWTSINSDPDSRETSNSGNDAPTAKNKQIIGFAKFTTREEALQARDVLNGFRVDPDRGCILKAELAKKNLHTKRAVPHLSSRSAHHSYGKPQMSMRDAQVYEQPISSPIYASIPRRPSNSVSVALGSPTSDKSSGHPTSAPINEMVARLESFSKTIPTYAGNQSGLPVPSSTDSHALKWSCPNNPNILHDTIMMTSSGHEWSGTPSTMGPLEMAQQLQNMSLSPARQGSDSTIVTPGTEKSFTMGPLDSHPSVSSSMSRLSNNSNRSEQVWGMSNATVASPGLISREDYLGQTKEQDASLRQSPSSTTTADANKNIP